MNKREHIFNKTTDYNLIPFTKRLQEFHRKLSGIDWGVKAPQCVFIRDFDKLPVSASFDIDLMANRDNWPSIIEIFESEAKKCELVFLHRISTRGLFIFIFDVYTEENKRSWSYYEVRKEISLTKEKKITFNDINTITSNGFPLPSLSWQYLLYLHQGIRKGKLLKYKTNLKSMLEEDINVQNLCEIHLGLSSEDIRIILKDPYELEYWRKKTGINYAGHKKKYPNSLFFEVKKKIAKKIYFLHTKGPIFFTLNGPDGVGKTTIIKEISKILRTYPFSHEIIHHISSWKKDLALMNQRKNVENNLHKYSKNNVSFIGKLLRLIYSNLPSSIQGIWVYSSNYNKYSSNLNRYILDYFYNHKIVICDRFIYDLWAKEQVSPGYIKILQPFHFIFCKLLRPPTLAIIINDHPENIYERKQELSINQIEKYQCVLKKNLKSLGVPTRVINVSGRIPEDIAKHIVSIIFEQINPDIFFLIRERLAG